jgi:glycosyltransferase involved in cell wall biosynthesis
VKPDQDATILVDCKFMGERDLHDGKRQRYRAGIFTSPAGQSCVGPITHLITIFNRISQTLIVITGNSAYTYLKQDSNIQVFDISHPIVENPLKKVLFFFYAQIIGSIFIIKTRKDVEVWFFFMGGEREFLPILTAKILKKSPVLILPGSILDSAKHTKDPFILPIRILREITHFLVTNLILYSPNFCIETGTQRYQQKILFAHEQFVDFNAFHIQTPFENRSCVIGFFGRLSGEKGILNFVHAIPQILDNYQTIQIIIGGDGPLRCEIESFLEKRCLKSHVKLTGWIEHEKLSEYLNMVQLLIIPSYTEGIPNILLEAMACGTPVLATPVGVIPDIIKDGETGLIMPDNTPESISKNILRSLNSDLKKISDQGRYFVEANYSFEKTIEDWNVVFQNV